MATVTYRTLSTQQLKLATVTYRTITTQQPTSVVNLLHFSDISRTHRSSVSKQRFVPKTKLSTGKRAFSVAAPIIWNQLPIMIISSETVETFHKKLKTYLLEISFPPYIFGGSMLQ